MEKESVTQELGQKLRILVKTRGPQTFSVKDQTVIVLDLWAIKSLLCLLNPAVKV